MDAYHTLLKLTVTTVDGNEDWTTSVSSRCHFNSSTHYQKIRSFFDSVVSTTGRKQIIDYIKDTYMDLLCRQLPEMKQRCIDRPNSTQTEEYRDIVNKCPIKLEIRMLRKL